MTTLANAPLLRRPVSIRPRAGTERATVTVVIPCYNYARYLPASVGSAASQSAVDVEIIVVDDASTDDSVDVATRLASELTNLYVLRNDRNCGPVETFNFGARHATGDFLVRLDADDMLTPGSLERAVAVAQHFPEVGLVYGHPLHFSDGQRLPEPRLVATNWTVWQGRRWLADRCRQGSNVITSPEVLMRRAVVEQVGYQAPLRHSHDMEHWLRIAAFSDVAYVHGADQAWHREHDQSLSALGVDGHVDLEERLRAFETLFSGPAGELPGADELRRCARAALARSALTAAGHAIDARLPVETYRAFLDQAMELDPTLVDVALLGRITRRAARGGRGFTGRTGALARRVVFHLQSQSRWRRWHRRGVF